MAQAHCDLRESTTLTMKWWQLRKQYTVKIERSVFKTILILTFLRIARNSGLLCLNHRVTGYAPENSEKHALFHPMLQC